MRCSSLRLSTKGFFFLYRMQKHPVGDVFDGGSEGIRTLDLLRDRETC